ncbi:hypothetical protein AAG570_007591 [Ranatra chinensis]|uniref:Uncharacterized protein n=1 Tax=Ranatra chinensis TaxID=642074 RepID=A0ABD0XTY3_9HEMI
MSQIGLSHAQLTHPWGNIEEFCGRAYREGKRAGRERRCARNASGEVPGNGGEAAPSARMRSRIDAEGRPGRRGQALTLPGGPRDRSQYLPTGSTVAAGSRPVDRTTFAFLQCSRVSLDLRPTKG